MTIKELEEATKELLCTLNMNGKFYVSLEAITKIKKAYHLADKQLSNEDIEQLSGVRDFIVKFFLNYFNERSDATTNDLLVYSAIIYVLNDEIQAQGWMPKFDSSFLAKLSTSEEHIED